MALSCLTYLKWLFSRPGALDETCLGNYPCARLAAQYFDDYIREVVADPEERLNIDNLNTIIIEIMDDKDSLLKLVQLCDPDHDQRRVNLRREAVDIHTPLYYASLLGLSDIVQHYVDIDPDNRNYVSKGDYGSPLVAASAEGRTRCVEVLLASGADPNLSGNEYWGKPLAAAVENNHVEVIKLLLAQPDVSVNCIRFDTNALKMADNSERFSAGACRELDDSSQANTDEMRGTEPMAYIAAYYNSPEAMDILFNHKVDVNLTGGFHHTALIAACLVCDENTIHKLLDHNAISTIYSGDGDNALIAACFRVSSGFSPRIYSRLIQSGVDVNRKGTYRYRSTGNPKKDKVTGTALYFAAGDLSSEIAELLISRGADVNVRDCGNYDNPLQLASWWGNTKVIRVLLQHGADPTFQGAGGWDNCLAAAVGGRHVEAVKTLLDAKLSPNIKGGDYSYPLINACHREPSEDLSERELTLVKLLLESGADANIEIKDGRHMNMNPLTAAARRRDSTGTEISRLLVSYGAEICPPKGGTWGSALDVAILYKNMDTVEFLIDKGFDIQVPGGHGYPLVLAISEKVSPKILKRLIKTSNVDQIDDFHRSSALHMAARMSNFEAVNLLLEAGANPNISHWGVGSVLQAAVRCRESVDMVTKLYKYVDDKNMTNSIGQNVLLFAIVAGAFEAAKELINMGYTMDFTDKEGCNGMHYAAARANFELIDIGIKEGLDVNSKDNGGWTPLHYAALNDDSPSFKVITTLMHANADITIKDKQGLTPAMISYSMDKPIAFELLQDKKAPKVPSTIFLRGATGFAHPTRRGFCIGCGNQQLKRYTCRTCRAPSGYCKICSFTKYLLCVHCVTYREQIHPQDHDWDLRSLELQSHPPAIRYAEIDGPQPSNLLSEHVNKHQNFQVINGLYYFGNDTPASSRSNVQYLRGDTSFPNRHEAYFELTIQGCADVEEGKSVYPRICIGLAAEGPAKAGKGQIGWEPHSWGYHSDDGKLFASNWHGYTYASTFGLGDTVGVGIERSISQADDEILALFFTKNGKHLGAFLVCMQESLFPVITTKNMGVVLDVNFGKRSFVWQGERYKTPRRKEATNEGSYER